MRRALLVPDEDVVQPLAVLLGVLMQGVIDGQNRPAGIAEQGRHTLIQKRAHDDLGARHEVGRRVGGGIGVLGGECRAGAHVTGFQEGRRRV